jgi:hypothetical protein
MAKKGWQTCGHCEGSGSCRNKLKCFQTIFWLIPFPVKTSDASCLIAAGIDPTRQDAVVKCDVCKGTGYVWLDPEGPRPQARQQ